MKLQIKKKPKKKMQNQLQKRKMQTLMKLN